MEVDLDPATGQVTVVDPSGPSTSWEGAVMIKPEFVAQVDESLDITRNWEKTT